MNGAVCPACGVAVVPGYVRCPKCRSPLPRRAAAIEGGTAVESASRGPLLVVLAVAVLIVAAFIAFFALRAKDDKTTPSVPIAAPEPVAPPEPTTVAVPEPTTQTQTAPRAPSATELAAELERNLNRQRLWSKVTVDGPRLDVRSGSCADPAMAPLLDAAAPSFKAAGLTNLRCVEQSGQVASERDL